MSRDIALLLADGREDFAAAAFAIAQQFENTQAGRHDLLRAVMIN